MTQRSFCDGPLRLLDYPPVTRGAVHSGLWTRSRYKTREVRHEYFQVYEHKAFEEVVVKNEINVEVGSLCADAKLAAYEGEALAEFHEKVTQAGDDGVFNLAFSGLGAFWEIEKFENIGVLHQMQRVGFRGGWSIGCRRLEETLEAAGLDSPLQGPGRPLPAGDFLNIVFPGLWVFDPHNQPPMGPAQFATQCVAISCVRKGQVKLPEIPEIGDGHALTELLAERAGKVADELAAYSARTDPPCSSSTMRRPMRQ